MEKILKRIFNTCNSCKHNDVVKAKKMFYADYCDLMECQIGGRFYCKYKKKKKRVLPEGTQGAN